MDWAVDGEGKLLRGCLEDVDLAVLLHPELMFHEYAEKYEDDTDDTFKKRVDKAKQHYLFRKEKKQGEPAALQTVSDIKKSISYGVVVCSSHIFLMSYIVLVSYHLSQKNCGP